MKKLLTILMVLMFAFSLNVEASVRMFDGTTDLGHATELNLGTTLEGTETSGQIVIQDSGLKLTETVGATNAIAASECGTTFYLSHATEFASTLPTPAAAGAGCYMKFVVAAAPSGASYTVVTSASANLFIGGINELEVDTTNDGPYDADGDTITFADGVAVVGDYVDMETDGTSWYINGQANADGGITVTKAS